METNTTIKELITIQNKDTCDKVNDYLDSMINRIEEIKDIIKSLDYGTNDENDEIWNSIRTNLDHIRNGVNCTRETISVGRNRIVNLEGAMLRIVKED